MKYANFISRSNTEKVYLAKVIACENTEHKGLYYISNKSYNALENNESFCLFKKRDDGEIEFIETAIFTCDEDGDSLDYAFGKLHIKDGDKRTYYLPLEIFNRYAKAFDSLTEARKADW